MSLVHILYTRKKFNNFAQRVQSERIILRQGAKNDRLQ